MAHNRLFTPVSRWLPLLVASLFLCLFLIPSSSISAQVFNPGCSVANLVSAITTAGSNGQADTINLQNGCTYTLTAGLVINADGGFLLTINGNNAILDGDDAVLVLSINSAATTVINNVTISGGTAGDSGGGIYNGGGSTLTLTNSTISGNTATNGGGGISNGNGSTLTLNNSTVSGNTAPSGGGILNTGTMTLDKSTISGNTASYGGGIYNSSGSVILLIKNSTIANNTASYGGGIHNADELTVRNSTLSNNSASVSGGNIRNSGNTLTLENSIAANSTAGGDCSIYGGSVNATNSLIEDGGCGITNGVNGNKTGDPNLGALTGSPAYFPLNAGSIAINAGSNAFTGGMTTDQPGNARIQSGTVDMGSFEFGTPPTNTPTPTPGTPTTTPPAPNTNLVVNGTFDSTFGSTYRWSFNNETHNVTGGQLNIAPTAAGGGFYQQVNFGSGGEIFEVTFQARNASMTHKTLNVIVRATDYSPSYNCVFGMTANTPFQYYTMRFDTSEGFIPMMLQFALTGDSTLGLVFDNITMMRKTGLTVPTTQCIVAPPANTDLVFNGAFSAGTGSWAAFNAAMQVVNIGGANGNVMEIARWQGTPNGGFYQYSPFSAPANAVLQFSFQIGNQSNQARVINMLVRSPDWTDMHSCFITVPANTPLTSQTILLKTSTAWSNIVMQGWIQVGNYNGTPPLPFRFDNISLQYLPASGFSGSTQCPGPLPMPQRMTDTPSPTITPSLTPSLTATYTATATPTATSTETALPSATPTATASEPPTDVPTLEPPTITPEPPTDVPTLEPPTATAEPPTLTPEPPTPTPEPPTAIPSDTPLPPTPEPPTSTPEPTAEVTQSP